MPVNIQQARIIKSMLDAGEIVIAVGGGGVPVVREDNRNLRGVEAVIDKDYASARLPGKPLLEVAGRPMLQHVFERACESRANEVIIATDDVRIQVAAEGFGAAVCMTSAEHTSGTERLGEVVEILEWGDEVLVVNLQGMVAAEGTVFGMSVPSRRCETIQSGHAGPWATQD